MAADRPRVNRFRGSTLVPIEFDDVAPKRIGAKLDAVARHVVHVVMRNGDAVGIGTRPHVRRCPAVEREFDAGCLYLSKTEQW